VETLDERCVCHVIYTTRLVPGKHTQPSPPSLSWLVLAASSRFPLDSSCFLIIHSTPPTQTSLNVALYPPSQSIFQFLFNPLFHFFSLALFSLVTYTSFIMEGRLSLINNHTVCFWTPHWLLPAQPIPPSPPFARRHLLARCHTPFSSTWMLIKLLIHRGSRCSRYWQWVCCLQGHFHHLLNPGVSSAGRRKSAAYHTICFAPRFRRQRSFNSK